MPAVRSSPAPPEITPHCQDLGLGAGAPAPAAPPAASSAAPPPLVAASAAPRPSAAPPPAPRPPVPAFGAASVVSGVHVDVRVPNQDAFGAAAAGGVYVVADGHGPRGAPAARGAVAELLRASDAGLGVAFAAAARVVDALGPGSGTTATVVVVRDGGVDVGNVGDSDAYFVPLSGAPPRALSLRHRHDVAEERARCEAAGGVVSGEYIMDAACTKMISVTRSLGDGDMRELGIVDEPTIRSFEVEEEGFCVVASDGLWDAQGGDVSPQVVADAVRRHGAVGCIDGLMDAACGSSRNPTDDCTILVFPCGGKRKHGKRVE